MLNLLNDIKNCKLCEVHLPLGANPVFTASEKCKIVIIGQAPGKIVHNTGIPWNDKSGNNLRNWLGVNKCQFYDENLFSLMPMGFCYPGTGKSGDLPPRKECAPLWHNLLLDKMSNVKLIILVGNYSQKYYLKDKYKNNLTETVKNYNSYLPEFFPLPHPSPRNNLWIAKNQWFNDVLGELKIIVNNIIND